MFLRKKEAQNKRSNCCSEVPAIAVSSGKQISACAEERGLEIIAVGLPWPSIG